MSSYYEQRILSAVRRSPNGEITKSKLQERLSLSDTQFQIHFSNLQSQGRIVVATTASGEEKVKEAKRVRG